MLHGSLRRNSQTADTSARHSTLRLRSFDGHDWYNISFDQKTCDCPNFNGRANGCEHLTALGIHRLKPFTPSTHPTFSQALSALVKSIRLRRVEDAVYWLVYLDTFKGAQYRLRTARRLLISSAEDGHSVAVMEQVGRKFWSLSKPQTDLIDLVAEAIRLCKLPNWWHPDSGGPEYIYQSLIGQRAWFYKNWDHSASTVQNEIGKATREETGVLATHS
jgi:hypothetical protein